MNFLEKNAYRPVDGIIRWSRGENWNHYLTKCIIVRMIKEGIDPVSASLFVRKQREIKLLSSFIKDNKEPFPNWATPIIYTEAIFKKNKRADVLTITRDGTYVIEIAESEGKKSLIKKEKYYKSLSIRFVSVLLEN